MINLGYLVRRPRMPISFGTRLRSLSTEEVQRSKLDLESSKKIRRRNLRFIFPEFLPDPDRNLRNHTVEKLVRRDMLARRRQVEIPEFYPGSVIAVTTSDPNSTNVNKQTRFLGICIARGGTGLRAWCIVRNIVDSQGVEFLYELYSPVVQKVEIIRLEKRLDDELYYLRDAPHDIQTFPFDMEPEILPEGVPVPLNKTVIKLNPKPWTRYWERRTDRLVGYTYDSYDDHPNALSWKMKSELHHLYLNYGWQRAVEKYDLMLHYRETIPVEEQDAIWAEVGDELEERDVAMRKVAAKRAFSKPQRRH